MVKSHLNGVLRWFTSKINNGILEGINSLIQAAKARARGYRTKRNLITMIYLIAGKLDFDLPHMKQRGAIFIESQMVLAGF